MVACLSFCFVLQLFHRRLQAAESVQDLRRHVPMLQRLGPDGMSSDEEEIENGTVQYNVLVKDWRSEELAPWLRVFDAAARMLRIEPFPRRRGCYPRARHSTDQTGSSSRGVVGLPTAAYRPEWLARLGAYRRELLRDTDERYDFIHTANAMTYVFLAECFHAPYL